MLERTYIDVDGMKEAAVKEALEAAERRHTRELRAALHRLQKQADDDKEKSMARQKKVNTCIRAGLLININSCY